MIVGNGLIANAFREFDKEDVIFFASGVSNSLEKDQVQFDREENLIRKTVTENPNKLFVYFSTCSIYDSSKSSSRYVNHKLNMEHIVSSETKKYLIARVSNAVGNGGNSNLLMNYLYRAILNGNKISIHKNATRNLIDVSDVVQIVLALIELDHDNKIYNIAYLDNFMISEVVEIFEKELNKQSLKEIMDCGESYSIDVSDIEHYFSENNPRNYLRNLIRKYYLR